MKKDVVNKEIVNPIDGNFILAGKPIFEENIQVDWLNSYVRLSEIKTIHQNKNSTDNAKRCIFYTYKDEWYAVYGLDFNELMIEINNYLSKGKSHGSEIPRDHIGREYL